MSILHKVTWKAMAKNKARTGATIVGVTISAAMFMAVVTIAFSLWDFLARGYIHESGDYFVSFNYATEQQLDALRQDHRVSRVSDYGVLGYHCLDGDFDYSNTYMLGAVDEDFLNAMSVPLESGRLPENSGELVIPHQLNLQRKAQGLPEYTLGQSIRLSLQSKVPMDNKSDRYGALEDISWERDYTLVGIMDARDYTIYERTCVSMLTFADGQEGNILWHRLFARTTRADDAQTLGATGQYGETSQTYGSYLQLFGVTGSANATWVLLVLVLVLFAIIMVATISLIGNAFSISVSERIKQFGLLSSIGATGKQLRQSVRFEAVCIAGMGIPVGLLCGYVGIAVTIELLRDELAGLFAFGADGSVVIRTVFSPLGALVAMGVCLLTILLSTWMPALRATGLTPLEAIRGSREYQIRPGALRSGRVTAKLFGLPGMLAQKYHRVSRRKYRATMVSLAISLVLFTFSGYFSGQLSMMADTAHVENYDFSVFYGGEDQMEVYELLRGSDSVSASALVSSHTVYAAIANDDLIEGYKQVMETGFLRTYPEGGWSQTQIELIFLEDRVLAEHLRGEGIDPQNYLDKEGMLALAIKQDMGKFYIKNEDGDYIQQSYFGYALEDDVGTLRTFAVILPDELVPDGTWSYCETAITEKGETMLVVYGTEASGGNLASDGVGQTCFLMDFPQEFADGQQICNYYAYDPETGTRGTEILASTTMYAPRLEIGDHLQQMPFGVRSWNASGISLVLPLSKLNMDEETQRELLVLTLKAEDYPALRNTLEEMKKENLHFSFADHLADQLNQRGTVTLIRVFSLGFIVLIALISAANVFNTISTNIALRRRDFGMLRSVGMKTGELYRMMVYECLIYGVKALLWGLPLSYLGCWWLHGVMDEVVVSAYRFPWGMAILGAGCIFLVVFVTMLYGIGKLKKDNPIDAIRLENE